MNKITEAVRQQYNHFPYPSIPIGEMLDEVLYSTNFEFVHYLCTGKYKSSKNIKILDAGCGTGYSTLKLAQQNPDAVITAVDLSANSLKMAKERIENAGISPDKINFMEADLLNLPEFPEKFDYIVCTGVLHHTASPETGLKNLVSNLKDDGLMYLMLYSEYGRFYLNQMRTLIKIIQSDKDSLSEGMEIGRELINSLDSNNQIYLNYKKSYDASKQLLGENFAASEAQFIDAYVNAHELTYNIEKLFSLIEDNNLNFIRFQDEPSWDLNYLLKSNKLLLSKTENLSKKEKYKIGEIINAERNFAFFVSKNKITYHEYSDKELSDKKVIFSPLIKIEKSNNIVKILNPLGTGIQITDELFIIYETATKFSNIKDILNQFKKLFSLPEQDTLQFIRNLEKECLLFFVD